jgi:L-aspartate oxidase
LDYHPDREFAPRDVVSRAIFSHLQKTSDAGGDDGNIGGVGHVYLDLKPIANEFPIRDLTIKDWDTQNDR